MEDQERKDYEEDIKSLLEHNKYLACKKQKTMKVVKLILLSPAVLGYIIACAVCYVVEGIFKGVCQGLDDLGRELRKFL